MPLIAYACDSGHVIKKLVRQAKDAPAHLTHCCKPDCDSKPKRQLSTPSSVSKITIDNGHQARAVEILPNIVEINEARANKDYRED